MALTRMTAQRRAAKQSRVMLFGPPNSGKTTAAAFTSIKPAVLISVPGEHGYASIPYDIPGLIPLVWGGDVSSQTSESIKREVESEVKKVIAGKYDEEFGKVRTLIIDGYHKMYNHYLNIGTGGKYNAGEDFEARLYTRAHRMSDSFLDLCLDASSLEFVTFTTWNAKELDKAGAAGGPSHEWPDLPGKAAKEMVGKFSVVCYSRSVVRDGKRAWEWLLKPDTEIWGNSVKMDARLVSRLPATCPQNFSELYRIIGAAQQEVEREETVVENIRSNA